MCLPLPPNVRLITRGWLNSNSVLFLGESPLLIDTGYETHAQATIRLIESNDVSVADLATIVHTHCHSDHIGGTHALRAASKAKTAMHPVEAEWLRIGERLNSYIADPKKMALHALKQYFLFTLMLKDGIRADELEPYISRIPAFVDYAQRYLDTEPRALLPHLLDELRARGHIVLRDGVWQATGPR